MESYTYTLPKVRRTEDYLRRKYLRECYDALKKPIPELTFAKLIRRSETFPIEFPISSVRSLNILQTYPKDPTIANAVKKKLVSHAVNAYPIVHEDFIQLAIDFLEHKKAYGSEVERRLYEFMDLVAFITRLLKKRAVTYYGASNKYLLLNGSTGSGGGAGWERVGTDNQLTPLLLSNCLSYDEMKLSALISVSSPSYFINHGARTNGGIPMSSTDDLQEEGVVLGIVGCRLQKFSVMEYQDMIIDRKQNRRECGYGGGPLTVVTDESEPPQPPPQEELVYSNRADFLRIFSKFYMKEGNYPTWEEASQMLQEEIENGNAGSFELTNEDEEDMCIFDKETYKLRCRMTAEVILLEANHRGCQGGAKVFLHIVDCGLAAFQAWEGQECVLLQGFGEAIIDLDLPHISDIFFSWFQEDLCVGGVENKQKIGKNNICVHFGLRYPHEKFEAEESSDDSDDEFCEEQENKLTVVTYTGSENSLPGNEFWLGLLAASNDAAQASSSQISELHNPHINPYITGNNVRVASPSIGNLVTLNEYLDHTLAAETEARRKCVMWMGTLREQNPEKKTYQFSNIFS